MTRPPQGSRMVAALVVAALLALSFSAQAMAQGLGDPLDTGEDPPAEEPTEDTDDAGDEPEAEYNPGEAGEDEAEDEEPACSDDPDDLVDENGEETGIEPCAPPQVSLADLVSPAPAAVDLELQAALRTVGFLDTWYSVTSTHPRLSLVEVAGPAADAARAALFELLDELIETRETTTILVNANQDAVAQRRALDRTIEVIDATLATLVAEREAAVATMAAIQATHDAVESALTDAAVGLYVNDNQVGVGAMDDVENYNDHQELVLQVGATIDELLEQRDLLETRMAAQQTRLADIDAAIATEEARRADTMEQRDAVTETIDQLNEQITELTQRRTEIEGGMAQSIGDVQRERLLAVAPSIGVSLVTLDAYVQAADDIGDFYPSCGVRWEILAGIAQVESNHARFGGASVGADGKVNGPTILGPLLDGTLENTAVIVDTDGGALDGNDEFDAAVGPFQFIPGTWRGFALDSTGDGFADPHNLYDAALSAAGYLCASSNLTDDAGIRASVLSYNQSLSYLANVTGFARDYITTLALPEAAYDPVSVDATDGWGVHFGEKDEYESLGLLGLPEGKINAPRLGQLVIPEDD